MRPSLAFIGLVWVGLSTLQAQTRGLLREVYEDIGGASVRDLTSHATFPSSPTNESIIPTFETPTDVDEDYGQRVSGYVLPPQTGNYVFWIASDDGGTLFLSTDETPSKKVEIASVPGWTTSRLWTKYPTQKSKSISLVAGQRYYVEALMKERGGGDNLAVRWQLPNGRIEAPIPSSRLQPIALGVPDIVSQPANATVTEGKDAEFAVELSRQIGASFQWQRNGINIPGATGAILELESVGMADSGSNFRVVVTNSEGSTTSVAARLTVTGDQTGPRLVSVLNLGGATSLTVTFSEPVDPVTATNVQNFAIDRGIRINGAKMVGGGETVVLETSALTPGVVYQLTVANVMDRATIPNMIVTDSTTTFSWDFDPLPLGDLVGVPEPAGPAARTTGLVITEIHYHPRPQDDGLNLEFIELYNSQPWAEDLSGHRISGDVDYHFPEGTQIAGEGYLVVAVSPADVKTHYGIGSVLGPTSDSLPNSSGTLRLRNRPGALLLEVGYGDRDPWPVSADGFGHSLVLARPSYGQGNVAGWFASQSLDGSPGRADAAAASPYSGLLINEFLAHTDDPILDYVELYNYSDRDLDLSGCQVTDSISLVGFTFPEGSGIPARGFVALDQSQLGFSLSSKGEAIVVRAPDGGRVIDSVRFGGQQNGVSSGRFPDGSPHWSFLVDRTMGASNAAPRSPEIVFNEIMYHPISEDSDDEYLEILNRSTAAIDLSGWRLNGEVSYVLPPETVLPAGGYLVIAKNADRLITNYPNLSASNTIGNFSGTLSNRGGRIVLEKPDEIQVLLETGEIEVDRIWIAQDEVTYHDGGRWGQWSDGGGSSLELMDAKSDNRFASNWEDSDETSKGEWTTVEHTGRLDNGRGAFNEVQFFLLGGGECLVDDLFVAQTGAANRVSNGNFESGLDGWVIQGNHIRSELSEPGEGFQSERSLYLRATSGGDNGANRIESDLTSSLSNGQRATLRAKVRWLRGHSEILIRVHGNPIELSGRLSVPLNLGSPGEANSQARVNSGPAIVGVSHDPILPRTGQSVEVRAQVSDPDGLSNLVLKYRTDRQDEYRSAPMTYRGAGSYTANIPGQSNRTIVAFYVEATDAHSVSVSSQFPENPFNRECLVRFGESTINSDFGTYRLWIADDNVNTWRRRVKLSNELIDSTFVYGNFRAIYNSLGRFRGSPFIRPGYGSPASTQPTAMVVAYPKDDLFLGTTKINMDGLEQPGRDNTLQRERTSFWIAKQMDLPFSHQRYVQFVVNGFQKGEVFADSQQPSSEYVETWFPQEKEGDLYKIDDWFEFNDSVAREFNENAMLRRYVSEGDLKVARYRWSWEKRPNGGYVDDYSSLLELVEALNAGNASYEKEVDALVDVEQWMRIFAVRHIVGDWDGYGYDRGKNMSTYKPKDGKWKMILWDLDFSLGGGSRGATASMFSTSDSTVRRLYELPAFRRAYLRAWQDAIDGPLLDTESSPVIDAVYNAFRSNSVTASNPSSVKSWIRSRRNYLIRELARENADFEITSNSGNEFSSSDNVVNLAGTAPVSVKNIRVNGIEYPIRWTSVKNWRIQVPLSERVNLLSVEGFDLRGEKVVEGSDSIQVIFTGEEQNPRDHLVINEVMYHPADGGAGFVEIHNSSTTHSFDLSDYTLNGVDFRFDSGFVLEPRGYAVVVSDRLAFAQNYGDSIPIAGEFKGRLANDGETISLVNHKGGELNSIVVDEVTYDDQAPWPLLADGQGSSLQLIDSTTDNRRVAHWASVAPTGKVTGPQTLIKMDSSWRYNQSGTNLGTRWRASDFDDSNWETGEALLYVETSALPADKNTRLTLGEPTYYFRNRFNLEDASGVELEASLIVDDGAVVYLNGTEVMRVRMGSNNVTFGSFASETVTNAQLEGPFSLPSSALVAGENVIAVEVHQTNATSSDIVFGLSLVGESRGGVAATPGQANSVLRPGTNLPSVWLNEVLPGNQAGLRDGAGEFDPWIELHNSGETTVSLNEFYLAPNYENRVQWQFPDGASIGAGEYKIVWVDGEPNESKAGEWHTNFRLEPEAGSVVMSMAAAAGLEIVDYLNYLDVRPDRSYGALPNGSPNRRQSFFVATPGEANVTSIPKVSVTINEWMADNVSTIANPINGGFDDWFELYNAGDAAVDLSGYFLTDDINDLQLFEIPSNTVIEPKSFLMVWAGGDELTTVEKGALFVGFRLSRSGEVLTLSGPGGTIVDQLPFSEQKPDVSQGRLPDGNLSRIGVLTLASPGSANVLDSGPNLPPIILPLPDLVIDEGERFQLNVGAFDPDGDSSLLRYELGGGHPIGTVIDSTTGEISWLTGEIHGPGRFTIPVTVTDGGNPAKSSTATYGVRVGEVNQPPVIGSLPDQTVAAGATLRIVMRAVDIDLPAQGLQFSLDNSSPVRVALDPETGEVLISPDLDLEPGVYRFVVSVSDDGTPVMTFSREFAVNVILPTEEVELEIVSSLPGEMAFEWATVIGAQYTVQSIENIGGKVWENVGALTGDGARARFSEEIGEIEQRFYRVIKLNP
ncbi:lamin tail domain-containing protein [bacterium]|nr:lamin tail domain-containing protein [bacterium]MDB4796605.1 lamin tail domain-containing protein [bacterium]